MIAETIIEERTVTICNNHGTIVSYFTKTKHGSDGIFVKGIKQEKDGNYIYFVLLRNGEISCRREKVYCDRQGNIYFHLDGSIIDVRKIAEKKQREDRRPYYY